MVQAREDNVWAASKVALQTKPPEEKQRRDTTSNQADHDRNSRTNTVLVWVGTNILVILVFTSQAFQNWSRQYANGTFNPYLSFLFYALASQSVIRFLGSTLYLIFQLCRL